ncbi:MAG: hypothetical protein ACOX4G_15585 [Limnochordia bacterium]
MPSFCQELRQAITNIDQAIGNLRNARALSTRLTTRRILNRNINTLLAVRASKRRLRDRRCND